MKDSINDILKSYWGYDSFRPKQQEIIESVLAGKDTLALLPTGGGKSICYQVPALAQNGICLVISPLIALMKDQVENLKKRGIGALVIYSGMQRNDIVRTLENAREEYFKFLYVSPERLETSLFKEYLPALNINLIAVDEAHCISQWGYDFRPPYLRIAELRKELQAVPVLAVTASATMEVQKDICNRLEFKTENIFRQPFERKNLSYSVFRVDSKINKLLEILKKVPGTSIVYCKSRKRTSEIANLLQMHGISADCYHAGLQQEERSRRQQDWIDNKIRVIVCTNAFGMGIDKAEVRTVIHVDAPDCLENYYQEAGRCGRDGNKAYAVLLYNEQDIQELSELHLTRYPSFEEIKNVYKSLVNFLQIPNHSGQDQSFNFRFSDFVRNFKLNLHQALYALKAMEQDGWIEYNEKNFSPSTLVFTTSKEYLFTFYKSHPEYEDLAVVLLRTYDGIFDFPAFISEAFLSKLTRVSAEEIKVQLQALHAFGIISYSPQNDEPQITFRKNRVSVEDFKINLSLYQKRKDVFVHRINRMIEYIKTPGCRSHFISNYFGEPEANNCGVCDNCLRQKVTSLTPAEFDLIAASILKSLSTTSSNIEELNSQLNIKKEKLWQVVQFLQSERKIFADEKGKLKATTTAH